MAPVPTIAVERIRHNEDSHCQILALAGAIVQVKVFQAFSVVASSLDGGHTNNRIMHLPQRQQVVIRP